MSKSKSNPSNSYLNATGPIPFTMTNDYMFHAVPQKNPHILKGLLAALLRIPAEDITNIEIRNPILLGESIKDKGFILDILLCINYNTYINLEMQVINEHNWPERSLHYTCRIFDQLQSGDAYQNTRPVIHIGFLDFQPFKDNLEFFATYKLLNIKNHHLYSDKFTFHVVDLTHIDLATDEDRATELDQWAHLFKATTWEDIKMLADKNEYMEELANTLYDCNDDFVIREQARARAEEISQKKYYLETIAKQEQQLLEQAAALREKDDALQEQASEIARLKTQLDALSVQSD